EDRLDAPSTVAILSYEVWQHRFGADRAALGRTVTLDEVPFTIVGVADEHFPGTSPVRVDAWVPIAALNVLRPATAWRTTDQIGGLTIAGRLRKGPSADRAVAELDLINARMNDGAQAVTERIRLDPVRMTGAADRREMSAPLAILFAGVLLVLLVACANV